MPSGLQPVLHLRQVPQLRLSLQQQQAIRMLEMNAQELQTFLTQQLEENPLLEETEESPETGEEELVAEEREESGDDEGDRRWESARPETLAVYLRFQLQMAASGERERALGEAIISSLDERGYFRGDLAQIAASVGTNLAEASATLALVQSFEPPGVAASDLRECLLLQLRERGEVNTLTQRVIEGHLDEIHDPKKRRSIARALGCRTAELIEALEQIRLLEPYPGCNFADTPPVFITPDLVVKEEEGRLRAQVNGGFLPRLRLSPSYQRMLTDPEAAPFLRKKLTSARWVLRSLEKREETLEKVAAFLVDRQQDFLRKGVYYLYPLSLKEASVALGVHESTVSRAMKGKYIDTPRGVFPLRLLLPASLPQKSGPTSESHVKEEIRRIITEEDRSRPLSDEQIATYLVGRGICLARRTVAKYRESLGIPLRGKRKEQWKMPNKKGV
ncbi:MAG: RNA polymerase factor sigma-54 [Coprothermobacterota bacterium]|nr:RNA polymerase factor sigma-54 [Coprothermobacterota bacterium]